MGEVVANMSMSLDGYVEDVDGGVSEVFEWMSGGEHEVEIPGAEGEFRTSAPASAKHFQDAVARTGALVCGRRLFDLTHGWGGRHPAGCPVFVVTHRVPEEWPHPDAPIRMSAPTVLQGGNVTHLYYRVQKAA